MERYSKLSRLMQIVNLYRVTRHSSGRSSSQRDFCILCPRTWTSIHTTTEVVISLQWLLALSEVNRCPRGSGTPWIYGGRRMYWKNVMSTHRHTRVRTHTDTHTLVSASLLLLSLVIPAGWVHPAAAETQMKMTSFSVYYLFITNVSGAFHYITHIFFSSHLTAWFLCLIRF